MRIPLWILEHTEVDRWHAGGALLVGSAPRPPLALVSVSAGDLDGPDRLRGRLMEWVPGPHRPPDSVAVDDGFLRRIKHRDAGLNFQSELAKGQHVFATSDHVSVFEIVGFLEPAGVDPVYELRRVNRTPPADNLVGIEIEGFRLERVVGEGAAGIVYEARRGREVRAVKMYRPELFARDEAEQDARIAREAELKQLQHKNLCRIFGHGKLQRGETTWRYLVMELVDGRPLDRLIAERGPLEQLSIRSIVLELLDAVEALHKSQLVHRDIKPANILIENGTDRVLLADFGIVGDLTDSGLTASHRFLGTMAYAAPEWLFCSIRNAGDRTEVDIYSLGATVAHMVTGQKPFADKRNQHQLAQAVLEIPLHVPVGRLPRLATATVRAMVAKQPERRPSIAECREAFSRAEEWTRPDGDEADSPLDAFNETMAARADVRQGIERERKAREREQRFYRAKEGILQPWREAGSNHPIAAQEWIHDFDPSGEQALGRWVNADALQKEFPDLDWRDGVSAGFRGVDGVVGVRVAYFLHGTPADAQLTRFVASEPPSQQIELDSVATWAGELDSLVEAAHADYATAGKLLAELLLRANR